VSETRAVSRPQAPLDVFRQKWCQRCLKKDTCYGDRELERNCILAARLDEMVLARQLRIQR
jgi:hypothetical protein